MLEKIERNVIGKNLVDILFDVVGTGIFAISINVFTAPNNIAPGGVSGIAIIFNYLFGIPIGLFSLLLNIPILLLGMKVIGRGFLLRTLRTLLISTVMIDYVTIHLPAYTSDYLLATIYGGVLMGLGLGIVFLRDTTTGGTDILGRVLLYRFPQIPLGQMIFVIDCVILVASGIVFQSLETILYGMICIFVCSKLIDVVLYGTNTGKMVLIVSDHAKEISKAVIEQLDRSATFLKGEGAYSGQEKPVLMCVVSRQQFHHLKKIVHLVDPRAFLVVSEVGETYGEGFKPMSDDPL